jgi:FkbM family methyltransferase
MTPLPAHSDLVYDVGMNNGDDSAFYLRAGFRVVAVEANPLLCRAAESRFSAEIAAGRMTVLNLAISDRPGEIDFWVNTVVSEWSSLIRSVSERAGHPVERIVVPTDSLDAVVRRHGLPHYLKIDIEHADVMCVQALGKTGPTPFLSVEFTDESLMGEIAAQGYRRFKLVEQVSHLPVGRSRGWEGLSGRMGRVALTDRGAVFRALRKVVGFNRILSMTRPSRKSAGLVFPDGASGTFGDDIPSEWMDREETMEHWRRHTAEWTRHGRDFWCDLHAAV